jgi:hypothetical protein
MDLDDELDDFDGGEDYDDGGDDGLSALPETQINHKI